LTPLIRKTQPHTKRINDRGIWVEPELLAESNSGRNRPMKSFEMASARNYVDNSRPIR
jgi:hypothetical protein